jgi:sulfur relay protein TusB/DsrH
MLYLVDKPFGKSAEELARLDPDPKIVLIKDGVYLNPEDFPGKVYAMEDDVEVRGLKDRLSGKVERIGYPELVDLIEENKVANFA